MRDANDTNTRSAEVPFIATNRMILASAGRFSDELYSQLEEFTAAGNGPPDVYMSVTWTETLSW